MKNYYSTVNEVVTTFSDISENGFMETITVHFEKPTENGFSFADYELPTRALKKCVGSLDERFL